MRTLSAAPTTYSCVQIYLWIRNTSLYRTASCVQLVSIIERLHCRNQHMRAHMHTHTLGSLTEMAEGAGSVSLELLRECFRQSHVSGTLVVLNARE